MPSLVRIWHHFTSQSYIKLRTTFEGSPAKRKAKELGIALVLSKKDYPKEGAIPQYPNALQSLGGPAPYEYVDALRGIREPSNVVRNLNSSPLVK